MAEPDLSVVVDEPCPPEMSPDAPNTALGRNRRQPLWDTQIVSSSSTVTTYPFFQDVDFFIETGGTSTGSVTPFIGNGVTLIFNGPPGTIPLPFLYPVQLFFTVGGVTTSVPIPGPAFFNHPPQLNFGQVLANGQVQLQFNPGFAPDPATPIVYAFLIPGSTLQPKTALDSDMPGPGGRLPRGWWFKWFGISTIITPTFGSGPPTAHGLDDKRKIWDSSYTRITFGSNIYLEQPTFRIPSGTGLTGSLSRGPGGPNQTTGDVTMGVPMCSCYYDLTVPAKVCRDVTGTVEVEVPDFQCEPTSQGKRLVCIDVPSDGSQLPRDQFENAIAAAYAKTPEQRKLVIRTVKKAVARCKRVCDIPEPRKPIDIGELESFGVDIVFPVRPSFTSAHRVIVKLIGMMIKPLSG